MNTVIVQLTSPNALKLLQDLEDLHLLKVLKENIPSNSNLSNKYAGKLNSEIAEKIHKRIEQSRSEWERNI